MAANAVHWHEGMFLRPHHLQAAHRHLADVNQTGTKWDVHYNWGLRSVQIDKEALGNHRFVVRALKARLRDGTLIRIPEDGQLPAIDLREALQRNTNVTIFLAVPVLRLGQANVASGSQAVEGRYRTSSQELEDENTGLNPQPIEMRLLNVRLVLSTQNQTGLEVLPIARVQKSAEAEAKPQLDAAYIPPILACDAWQGLQADLLQPIYDRIGQKIDLLAGQAETRGIAVESQAAQDLIIISQLRILNEAYALQGVMNFAEGVHPLPAYLELCRLVGQLSIFGQNFRPPPLPQYDHDDLGGCFFKLKHYLDGLLDRIIEPEYKQVPFEGRGLRMQVSLEPAWLEAAYGMFVGVKSTISAEDCVTLLTKPGQLDMKIGSSTNVDRIYQRGQAGLRFVYTPAPPRALPRIPGLIFFQVDRDAQLDEWANVQKSLTLAVRLNENRIDGSIEGQRRLTIRIGPGGHQTTILDFTLYVVRMTG